MRSSRFAGLLFCFALCCASLHAQASAGSVAGTVTDPSGGVVSGADPVLDPLRVFVAVAAHEHRTRQCGGARSAAGCRRRSASPE